MRNSKFVWVSIMLLMVLMLQGCGRKGALFLPKDTAPANQSGQKK